MVITVDGKQHSMTGDKITIDGLKEDTEYNVTYTFDMYNEKNGEYESVSYSVPTKTKPFVIPDSGIVITEINKTSVKAVKRETEQSSWIQDVVIEIDDELSREKGLTLPVFAVSKIIGSTSRRRNISSDKPRAENKIENTVSVRKRTITNNRKLELADNNQSEDKSNSRRRLEL